MLKIHRLPANHCGRDFVVGDLHGCRPLLDTLLAAVRFDPERDRLFLVGDLIDRGPDSPGCLALLEESWCHAVRGNHEQMLLDAYADPRQNLLPWIMPQNGGLWAVKDGYIDRDTLVWNAAIRQWAALLEELPHLLVVGEGTARFQIVHAELPPGLTDEDIDSGFSGLANPDWLPQYLLWSRYLMASATPKARIRPGLSATYCGHTVASILRQRESHLCLDTGSFVPYQGLDESGFGLTLIDTGEGVAYFSRPDQPVQSYALEAPGL